MSAQQTFSFPVRLFNHNVASLPDTEEYARFKVGHVLASYLAPAGLARMVRYLSSEVPGLRYAVQLDANVQASIIISYLTEAEALEDYAACVEQLDALASA